jgi:hypothetical protein
MAKMGMLQEFIKMVKLLFKDTIAIICLNGCITKSFKIEVEVRQGCPLAPYLFLIVGEVLNFMFKKVVKFIHIKGITLLRGIMQQIISQFANDTTLNIYGKDVLQLLLDINGLDQN